MKYLLTLLVFMTLTTFVGDADSRVAATSAPAARAAPTSAATSNAARSYSMAGAHTATNVAIFAAAMSAASSGSSADEVEDTIEEKLDEEERDAQTMFVDKERGELVVLEASKELLEETSYEHIYRVAGGDQFYIEKPIEEEAKSGSNNTMIEFLVWLGMAIALGLVLLAAIISGV